MAESKVRAWLLDVKTIVNVSRDPKMNTFWSDNNNSGVTYRAYINKDAKLGDRYEKNINVDLKIFGPKGGPHEKLQAMQKVQVEHAQMNIKRRCFTRDDRNLLLSAVDNTTLADDVKKVAKNAVYNGSNEFEIVASEGCWSLYDQTAASAAAAANRAPSGNPPVNNATPGADQNTAPTQNATPAQNETAPAAAQNEAAPKPAPDGKPTNPFKRE